jgi:hypothetical protein
MGRRTVAYCIPQEGEGSMGLTRRVFGTGILGLGVGLGLGLGSRALAERPSGARLAEALNRRLLSNPAQARFDVPVFEVAADNGATRIIADIRLDWAPGMRTRRVEGAGDGDDAAWDALLDAAVGAFAGAVPGFDGSPRMA